jgi:hypothetical protein
MPHEASRAAVCAVLAACGWASIGLVVGVLSWPWLHERAILAGIIVAVASASFASLAPGSHRAPRQH